MLSTLFMSLGIILKMSSNNSKVIVAPIEKKTVVFILTEATYMVFPGSQNCGIIDAIPGSVSMKHQLPAAHDTGKRSL